MQGTDDLWIDVGVTRLGPLPITGHRVAVRYQGLLQKHNIRHDLISREFGNGRASSSGAPVPVVSRSRPNVSSAMCRCAQNQEPTIDSTIAVVRANMQADRTALITSGMNFNEKDGAAFWPIYKEYQYERSKVDDRRVAVIKEYTQKYPTLTDAEAKAMAEQMLDCESRQAELKKKFYKKFNRVLPALTVTKFFQLQRRIDLMMDMQIEAALPPLTEAQYAVPAVSVEEPPQQ